MPRLSERPQDEENDLFDKDEEAEAFASESIVPLDANNPFAYRQMGYVTMVRSPDGGPGAIPAGALPETGEGLTNESMICVEGPDRPECSHHVAILWPAPGDTKGMAHKPMQLRRFCTRLAAQSELMELTDTEVYACTARNPIDVMSRDLIRRFESKQKEIAAESKRVSGKVEL